MSSLALTLMGLVLLVLESALATFIPLHGYTPNPVLPIVLFLAVAAEVHILRGALTCFVLGCLLDSFCGGAVGLQTFVLTATFLLARGAGVRLLAQGPVMQIVLCFIASLGFGVTVNVLRAIFEQPPAADFNPGARESVVALVRAATATALLSPLVLAATARIESLGTFKREKRTLSQ